MKVIKNLDRKVKQTNKLEKKNASSYDYYEINEIMLLIMNIQCISLVTNTFFGTFKYVFFF